MFTKNYENKKMKALPGFEPGISCLLDRLYLHVYIQICQVLFTYTVYSNWPKFKILTKKTKSSHPSVVLDWN